MRFLRYAFLLLPALGLAELGAQIYFSQRPPAFDDWFQIENPVRSMRKPGNLVVIAPVWADPAARRAIGDDLMPLRDVARPDESRYAHAVEVSILGERAPELAGWIEEARARHGKFTFRRLSNPRPVQVVYDFTDHVAPPAEARLAGATCSWTTSAQLETPGFGGHPTFPRERFECPGGGYFFVGVTVMPDDHYRPRRCIWSHPPNRGEVVTRFRGVPLGKSIHGHTGISFYAEREKHGAPVTLSVRVDGDTVGSVVHTDGDGWAPFDFDLGAHASARTADVEFAVSTPNNHERHFCFEADTR